MKLKLFFLIGMLWVLVKASACMFSTHTVIHFENNSEKFIDSAVIFISNYKLTLSKISPGSKIKKEVLKSAISTNNHDVLIRVALYDRAKSNFTGGLYYTDLSGTLHESYTITVNKDLNIVVQ